MLVSVALTRWGDSNNARVCPARAASSQCRGAFGAATGQETEEGETVGGKAGDGQGGGHGRHAGDADDLMAGRGDGGDQAGAGSLTAGEPASVTRAASPSARASSRRGS